MALFVAHCIILEWNSTVWTWAQLCNICFQVKMKKKNETQNRLWQYESCFRMPAYQNKKTCLCLWSAVLCTPRGALVPASLSAGEIQFLSHARSPNVVFTQYTTNQRSRRFGRNFPPFLVLLKSCGVKGAEEARGKSSMALDRGLELDPNSSWHDDMVCASAWGRTKGTDTLAILKSYHKMAQLDPHSFCISHTQDTLLWLHDRVPSHSPLRFLDLFSILHPC